MDYTNYFRFPSGSPPTSFNFNDNQTFLASTSTSPTGPGPSPQQQQKEKLISQPRQIHRNRISYSCHACRRRKVKCDRQHPICSNCTKSAESCHYDDHAVRSNNKGDKDQRTGGEEGEGIGSGRVGGGGGGGGGAKRRRTSEENSSLTANKDGGGEDRSSSSLGSGSTTATAAAAVVLPRKSLHSTKQTELEMRMNRLAEIVDRWYKDASVHGALKDGVNDQRSPEALLAGLKENGFAQNQHFLEALQQSTGPLDCETEHPNYSDAGHQNGAVPMSSSTEVDHSQLTIKIINAGIEAARKEKDQDVGDLGIGHLSIQSGGISRYVGTSFWGILTNEINELNSILKMRMFDRPSPALGFCPTLSNSSESSPASTGSSSSPGLWPPNTSNTHKECNLKATLLPFPKCINMKASDFPRALLQVLPSATFSDALYKSFLRGVHPVMPLIHAPSFDKEYKSFWSWYPQHVDQPPSDDLLENPTFPPLLIAVLYAGAVSLPPKSIEDLSNGEYTKESLTSHLYDGAMAGLATCAFPRAPTLSSLIAFLIVQSCLIREDEMTSCSFVGMAMRVAQSMGLHRDGSLFGLSEVECEVRRRVWWHTLHLDVQAAIATGLPPFAGSGEDMFDTKMVSELRDEYIGLPEGAPEPVLDISKYSKECRKFSKENVITRYSPAMILAVGRYEAVILLRAMISKLFAVKGCKKVDLLEMGKMIHEMKMKFEERIARIPARGIPEMGFIPPSDGENTPPEIQEIIVFNSWARIMLSLLSDRAFAVLYQPLLKSTKSTMWKHARNCALHISHAFLRKFLHLSQTPLFQPYQWFCPGTYQPLHATMILLLDLYERPNMPEAPKSRNFIDQVFSLFGESGDYSMTEGGGVSRPFLEGGLEAWRMLFRLRKRVYEKSGIRVPEIGEVIRGPGLEEGSDWASVSMRPLSPVRMATEPTMPLPPPAPPQSSSSYPPTPAVAGDVSTKRYEELLQMSLVIDQEDKTIYSDSAFEDFLKRGEALGIDVGHGLPGRSPPIPTHIVQNEGVVEGQFDSIAGGEAGLGAMEGEGGIGDDDLMDFDWEEWDQVFGKYVSVDIGDGIP